MSKHYIAPLSDNIERTSVFYKNRYGFTLAGDLYHLKNLDKKQTISSFNRRCSLWWC